MARCAESGEKHSDSPYPDVIVVCFVHFCISQTVRFPFLDKDAASFVLGATEKATSPPRLSCCSMQEADSRSKTLIDFSDATTSRFGLINASDNTFPDVSSSCTDLSGASVDQTWIWPPLSPDAIRRPSAENAIHITWRE